MMRRLELQFLLAAILAMQPWMASAAVITKSTAEGRFSATADNQGWWSGTVGNTDGNDIVFTGLAGRDVLRSFFTFDLSGVGPGEEIVAAVLAPTMGIYESSDPEETIGFFHVATPAAQVNDNDGASVSIFDDLGAGTSYGTFVVPMYGASDTARFAFVLNAAALVDLNAARGGYFTIGGSLLSLTTTDFSEAIMVGSCGLQCMRDPANLVLTTRAVGVPAPAALPLLGGLLLLGLRGYRGAASIAARRRGDPA